MQCSAHMAQRFLSFPSLFFIPHIYPSFSPALRGTTSAITTSHPRRRESSRAINSLFPCSDQVPYRSINVVLLSQTVWRTYPRQSNHYIAIYSVLVCVLYLYQYLR